jgi:serine/threonine protein kinase
MVIKVLILSIIYCRGYLAPEYISLGQLSEKIDVYSFGVVLLEIVSGRRSIDHKFDGDQIFLLNWVRIGRFIIVLKHLVNMTYLCIIAL